MKDMERQKFEKDFKDAFANAGVSPSDGLWTNIELEIEKTSTEKMRRSLVMYKLMAAASFTLAMCIGGAYYYESGKQNSYQNLAYHEQTDGRVDTKGPLQSDVDVNSRPTLTEDTNRSSATQNQNSKASGLDNNDEEVNTMPSGNATMSTKKEVVSNMRRDYRNNTIATTDVTTNKASKVASNSNGNSLNNSETADPVLIKTDNYRNDQNVDVVADINQVAFGNQDKDKVASLQESRVTTLLESPRAKLVLPQTQETVDPVAVMMAKLEQREKELANEEQPQKDKSKSTRKENLWTSVGFAAGSFNNNVHTSGSNVASATTTNGFAASNAVADNQNNASGTAYSVGLSMGTKVSERWIIHGGVNYLTQNSSYQANGVVSSSDLKSFRAASIAELKSASTSALSDKYVSTAPYNINNNLQFVSIPVQAGYMAVNRKLGLQFNAGVSTDLFLQNTITPQGGGLEKSTQGRGSDSPYRPVNFSGLFGTELSYKLGTHYRLALNPGLRYPINSIYKSEVGVSSNPITMDIGMRFRYIFR